MFWSKNPRLILKKSNVRLSIEQLEDRSLPSATPGAVSFDDLSINNSTFDSSRIILNLQENAPIDRTGMSSLGGGLYVVNLQPGVSVAQAISYYESQPGVVYASPDYEVTLQRTPNDPRYNSLYGLNNTGQTGGTVDADIDAAEAWDITVGSGNTIVAVIDTGVDYRHEDLAANMWRNLGEVPGDGRDNDGNGFIDDVYGYDFANNDGDPMDDNGHGTHVAGTIGAVGNNGIGVTGVNWNVKIMALKFLTASGSGSLSNAVRALNYAVQMGAKISNNSYGGGGFFSAMATAIDNARAAGHIFVAAAGNEGNNNDSRPAYPASYNYNNVISVAASDSRDNLASFSNYGATSVDLAAPGVGILSTTPNNRYSSFNGTSMAAPHVAGAVALVWDANPTLTYSQVISRILNNVDPVASLQGRVATGGRLNVNNALRAGTVTPPADTSGASITSVTFSGSSSTNLTSARIVFSEAINPSTFTASDIQFTAPNGSAISITGITAVANTGNKEFTVTFATQTVGGTYRMVIGPDIRDLAGNQMNQDGDAINGEIPADQFVATRTLVTTTTREYTNNTQLAIRDRATVTSLLTVNDSYTITDLNVRLNLRHTYNSDLVITLIAPDGTRINLVNRRGGSGDNFTNTVFDDEANLAISQGASPFSGSFRPEQALSGLDGKNVRGTWRLEIQDVASQDVGTLLNWTLVVQSSSSTAGGPRSFAVGGAEDAEMISEALEAKADLPTFHGSQVNLSGNTTVAETILSLLENRPQTIQLASTDDQGADRILFISAGDDLVSDSEDDEEEVTLPDVTSVDTSLTPEIEDGLMME